MASNYITPPIPPCHLQKVKHLPSDDKEYAEHLRTNILGPAPCLQMPEPSPLRTLGLLVAAENDRLNRLPVAGVEVVPLVAGAAPVVVRGPVVGLVVRVLGLLVVEASGLLVVTSLRKRTRRQIGGCGESR